MPTSENLLCKFVTYLVLRNISSTTIKVYLAAVRQLHIQQGLPAPLTSEMARLAQVLRGIKITQAAAPPITTKKNNRLPITPDLLRKVKAQWQSEGVTQDKIMLWAAFVTCFFGFLRSGEVCAKSVHTFDPSAELSVDCISVDSIQRPQVVRVHLRSSKTDPFREGVDVHLPHTGDDLCPVVALLAWLIHRGNSPGPLFRFQSGDSLTRPRLVSELRSVVSVFNEDAKRYSGHSFRSGAATMAAVVGVEDSQIKLLGRRKSGAYQHYLKLQGSHLAKIASRLSTPD